MTEILTKPVSAPNVWTGNELADACGWIIRFTEEDFADGHHMLPAAAGRYSRWLAAERLKPWLASVR